MTQMATSTGDFVIDEGMEYSAMAPTAVNKMLIRKKGLYLPCLPTLALSMM